MGVLATLESSEVPHQVILKDTVCKGTMCKGTVCKGTVCKGTVCKGTELLQLNRAHIKAQLFSTSAENPDTDG